MIKIKRKTRRYLILLGLAAAVVILAVLIVHGVRNVLHQETDTSAGLEYIRQEEAGSVAEIEDKISLLEQQERSTAGDSEDTRSVKEKFSGAVVIGDSTLANDIPILLAEKLQSVGITNVGILQQAIKGNRLLDDGAGILGMAYGEAMVDRFERDALNQPGVERIFLKVGVNDVVHPNCESLKDEARAVTAEEMIAGYKQLIEQAHERGIEVYLFTRTAWKGYTRNVLGSDDVQWSPEIDQMRQDINAWIRSSDNPADGYIDLDFMCTDETVSELKSEYTTDGAHFTALGQQTVVDAVPLEYFQ